MGIKIGYVMAYYERGVNSLQRYPLLKKKHELGCDGEIIN